MTEQRGDGDETDFHWDPSQYVKFDDHRRRAALELLARIPIDRPRLVCDLGCGPGNVSGYLKSRWPAARIIGVDRSPDMLARAAETQPGIEWVESDAADWRPAEPADVIYANATLHWLDDHARLLPALLEALAPGGWLAVQMPLSHDLPSHRLMRETLADGGPGGRALGDAALRARAARPRVLAPQRYYEILAAHTDGIDLWQTEYLHLLRGDEAVFEWVMGTGLRPILQGLDAGEREQFLSAYRQRLLAAYPAGIAGITPFAFRRLFIVAQRCPGHQHRPD